MAEQESKELTLTRILDAPRELVWRAWTEPELLAKWWGPQGVTNPVSEIEPKVGGKLHVVMLAGDELGAMAGQRWPMRGIFQEIDEPEKLVFTNQAVDENDNVLLDGLTTVTFDSVDGRTKLTMHAAVKGVSPQAPQMLAGMEAGWSDSLDKLAELVVSE